MAAPHILAYLLSWPAVATRRQSVTRFPKTRRFPRERAPPCPSFSWRAGAALGVACTDQPIPSESTPEVRLSQAGGIDSWWGAFSSTVDLCGYDVVDFTGQYHFVYKIFWPDGHGGFHWTSHATWNLRGVGQNTGETWMGMENGNWQSNWHEPGQDEWFIDNDRVMVIGHGSTPNFRLRALEHYSINANGELVNWTVHFEPLCD